MNMVAEVTIDATNLKLNEEMAGFPFYILRMEASSNTAAIRIQLNVEAEDYTGTYSIMNTTRRWYSLPERRLMRLHKPPAVR